MSRYASMGRIESLIEGYERPWIFEAGSAPMMLARVEVTEIGHGGPHRTGTDLTPKAVAAIGERQRQIAANRAAEMIHRQQSGEDATHAAAGRTSWSEFELDDRRRSGRAVATGRLPPCEVFDLTSIQSGSRRRRAGGSYCPTGASRRMLPACNDQLETFDFTGVGASPTPYYVASSAR